MRKRERIARKMADLTGSFVILKDRPQMPEKNRHGKSVTVLGSSGKIISGGG